MPITLVLYVADEVEVLIMMLPLTAVEPIIFPSAAVLPPIVIPEPVVEMPEKVFELTAAGMEEIETPAIVLLLMTETGKALVVDNNIPW